MIRSKLQIKSVSRRSGKSSKSNEGEHENSCRVHAHLLTPLNDTNILGREIHNDAMQHFFDYNLTVQITFSTDYQHPNRRLNIEEENKKK